MHSISCFQLSGSILLKAAKLWKEVSDQLGKLEISDRLAAEIGSLEFLVSKVVRYIGH